MGKHDFQEILAAEIISMTGCLIAGILLAFILEKKEVIPGLFILLPGFLEMRGSVGGSLSARINSALHMHKIKPMLKRQRLLNDNILASIILAIIVSIILGIFAYATTLIFFGINYIQIILIAFIAGMLSNIFILPTSIYVSFWLYRHKYDPDNIMGPYVTTIGDIASILSLMLAIMII